MTFSQNIFEFWSFWWGEDGSRLSLICSYARAFHKDSESVLTSNMVISTYVGNTQNTADVTFYKMTYLWINSFSILGQNSSYFAATKRWKLKKLFCSSYVAMHYHSNVVSYLISGSPQSRGRARHRATSARRTTTTSAAGRTACSTFNNKISIKH